MSGSQSGLPPLKRLVLAFRAAAHVADEDPASGGDFRYAIANSRVFNRLIVFCLKVRFRPRPAASTSVCVRTRARERERERECVCVL
jgi:hypothetical protein